jgi:uncharacterized repeat protein (TIGR03803 family)
LFTLDSIEEQKRGFCMRFTKRSLPSITFFLVAVSLSLTIPYAAAQSHAPKEKILFSFPASGDLGNTPNGVLMSDAAGNFYGVNNTGHDGSGAVYEISPAAGGGWTAKSIYELPANSYYPGALVMDTSGNLYGTLYAGGTELCTDGYGDYFCGEVYELSPDGSGGWSEKTIWNASQTEGWRPCCLAVDTAGNLYGTTIWAGPGEYGTVFELQRSGENWTHTVLLAFAEPGSEGAAPGSLFLDKAGNLFGTTAFGGVNAGGTVFELKKTKSGWQEVTLFQFDSSFPGAAGGYFPDGVIFDSAGNLYGGTSSGGVAYLDGYGVAFELMPTSSGVWQETVLHTFLSGGPGGHFPNPLVFDSAGNLYGTAYSGGSGSYGTVFQLKQSANGAWSEIALHSFPSDSSDGQYPNGGLLVDAKGNLYGTTAGGGSAGVGTVFEITP